MSKVNKKNMVNPDKNADASIPQVIMDVIKEYNLTEDKESPLYMIIRNDIRAGKSNDEIMDRCANLLKALTGKKPPKMKNTKKIKIPEIVRSFDEPATVVTKVISLD